MSKYPLFKLNDLASEWCKGQPFKKTDIAEHGQTPCIHYGELFTKYGVVINQCLSKTDVQGKRLSVYGDILFPASDVTPSGLARCSALMQDNVILGGDIIIMRPRSGNDSRYLSYAINYQKEQILQRVTGALIKHLSGNALKSVIIPVPPLADQVNLVSKLEKISELITFRKLQLEKIDQLASSRFIEMFGDPIKNPKAWITLPLGDLTEIVRGGSPRPIDKFLGGTIPWIKIGDATLGDDIYLHSTKDHIIEQGLSKTRYIKAGSLIFANCGVSLGFARIINFDGCIHDGWLALGNISERLNKIFLLKTLNHCTDFFRCTAPDGTQPNLNTGIMKKFVQIVPPLELQNEFAVFIEQLDKSKVIGEKQGIMLEKITCHDIL